MIYIFHCCYEISGRKHLDDVRTYFASWFMSHYSLLWQDSLVAEPWVGWSCSQWIETNVFIKMAYSWPIPLEIVHISKPGTVSSTLSVIKLNLCGNLLTDTSRGPKSVSYMTPNPNHLTKNINHHTLKVICRSHIIFSQTSLSSCQQKRNS